MIRLCLYASLLLLASFSTVRGADLKTTAAGVEISAGSLGSFTLSYPEFEPVRKAIEVKSTPTQATVRYEGGAQCVVAVEGDQIDVTFSSVPADVKSWTMQTFIDIGFAKGGTWKIAEKQGSFPQQKASPPQIASLNGETFTLKNAQGQSISFTAPQYSFQQLTDNREWNWAIYRWHFIVPWNSQNSTAKITVTSDLASAKKLIDAFGQSIADSFANKLPNADALKSDVAADKAYYAEIKTPKLDQYGGLPDSGKTLALKKTGFFHIEQKGAKSWLVDPDGNAFFHIGVCGFAPGDDYTYVKGREDIYEWLPETNSEFATAFRPENGDENFSFYLANVIRKFGAPYDFESHAVRMIDRLKKWGFNSIGAFSPNPKTPFPYVAHLPINEWEGVPRIPGAHEVWDPYDVVTEAKMAENLARELPAAANDPMLIGWFIVNEPRYDDLPRVIPSLNGKQACKRALVDSLKSKYKTVNAYNIAWSATAKSFDELIDAGLAVSTDAAKADVRAFVDKFLEDYFAQIERLYRKHDANHLLMGSRLQPITIENEALCRTMGKHLDVISYNYYTYGVDVAALKRYHTWCGGKPMMLSEFFWSSPKDSGLIGGRELSSQQERGLCYRNYVEQSASLGFVVGIEWFTLMDQATTGRWFSKYNGEGYNTGLLSVADRPWKPMLAEMMKTNHEIYDVLLNKRKPFKWDDPRLKVK